MGDRGLGARLDSWCPWVLGLAAILVAAPAYGGPALITVAPAVAGVRSGNTLQLTATTQGTNGPVFWSVNGVPGGNSTLGTVSSSGLFTAPVANPGVTLMVRAAVTNPVASIDAVVGWQNPLPVLVSLSPAVVNAGPFTVGINGSGFVPGAYVVLNGVSNPPVSVTPTQVSFSANLTNAGSATVVVVNPAPGAAASHPLTLKVAQVTVKVTPTVASVRLGSSQPFASVVGGASDPSVVWSVDGQPGGTGVGGSITANGLYTAPLAMPATNVVLVRAASVANNAVAAQSTVTLLNPIPVIQSVEPAVLAHGAQTVTINGSGFVPGSQVTCGGVAIPTTYVSGSALAVNIEVAPTPAGALAFRVVNPSPGGTSSGMWAAPVGPATALVTKLAAARFLEQATWGPSADSIAYLQSVGFEAWLNEQLAAAPTTFTPSTEISNNLAAQQNEFLTHAMTGADQLRQRVSFALGQVFVVSALKTGQKRQMVPYLNLLKTNALGSYSNLLRQVTLNPTMGVYLDMVYNDKANPTTGTSPNENYAREVMQLFSIGTSLLNPDGTLQVDQYGLPIPAYDEHLIAEFARAFTGWTFPGPAITTGHNPDNFTGPMIAVEVNHDTGSKQLMNLVELPAGQLAVQDVEDALATLVNHPNAAPFISTRLIQNLVESEPSPAYVARISEVFVQTQGDLGQVVRAILLDPEAREGDDPNLALRAEAGHLREPVLFALSVLRALDGEILNPQSVRALGQVMGQNLFYAPSVFNYYSPLYRLPGGQRAPEFQLVSSATSLIRANSVYEMVTKHLNGGVRFDLTPFTALAGSPSDLVDAVDHALLHGRLTPEMKTAIVTAVGATTDPLLRARNAIYLVATSPLYQIQH